MNDSPIERYLDDLVRALAGSPPRQLRHLLAEAEAHLRDDAAAGVEAGVSEHEAELAAVARFGPAGTVSAQERVQARTPYRRLVRQVIGSAVPLAAIAAIAIGVSGVLAAVLGALGGSRFVVDVTPGRTLAPSDCARWLDQNPGAANCHNAAVSDWMGEVVWYRIAVGVLGLVVLGAWLIVRRRVSVRLPAIVTDTVAATLFAAAALATTAIAVDLVAVNSGRASGQWISGAIAAGAAAAVFAARLTRDLRRSIDLA